MRCFRFSTCTVRFPSELLAVMVALALPLAGCSSSQTEKGKSADSAPGDAETKAGGKTAKQPAKPAAPTRAERWAEQAAAVEAAIAADKLDEAETGLNELAKIYESSSSEASAASDAPAEPAEPSAEQQQQVKMLQARIASRRVELANAERIEKLAAAKEAFNKQEYNEAALAVNRVLAISPTEQQLAEATALRNEIERILARQRELRGLIRMLGSDDRSQVQAANKELAAEPDVALSLLVEAVKEKDKPVLVKNALELMRRMKRPDVAMPAMVGVLAREEQKQSWPDAVREISRLNEPGAGKPLLDLVLASKNPEQRKAALESLVVVVDPPAETQIELLPLIQEDGPELALALQAIHRAVRVNGLYDLAAARNLEFDLTEEQRKQLAALPQRLAELMKTEGDSAPTPAAYEAQVLAVATRQQEPQVLTGLKVFGFSAETEEGPAAAVLDGVWNTVEVKNQWLHPVPDPANVTSSIVIDLGTERTVVGVRIWNSNQAGAPYRGWQEANVFVSDTPRPFDPVASGVVPQAPGAADTPDYSTLIPVDFVRGRYVKLQAKSLWKAETQTGLAEVQVIGF